MPTGLLFLPYLAGERSPHMDPHARGAWIGLSLAHDRRHMVRALIEGVGFAYADCLERMRALGIEPPSVMLTGGGARGELWRTILAAQLRVPLATGTAAEGPALGAAILAQVGSGVTPDLGRAVAAAVAAPTAASPPPAELVDDLSRGSVALPRALSGPEGRRRLRLVSGGLGACLRRRWRGGSLPVRLDRQILLQRHVASQPGAPEHTVDAVEGTLIALLGLVEALFRLDAA